jgi:hypothetical protein
MPAESPNAAIIIVRCDGSMEISVLGETDRETERNFRTLQRARPGLAGLAAVDNPVAEAER